MGERNTSQRMSTARIQKAKNKSQTHKAKVKSGFAPRAFDASFLLFTCDFEF
jgi:hypothetical protein